MIKVSTGTPSGFRGWRRQRMPCVMFRRRVAGLAAGVALCLGAGFAPTPAAAAELQRTDTLVNSHGSTQPEARAQASAWQLQNLINLGCLSTGILHEVVVVQCNSNNSHQKWTGEDGRSLIRNIQTGRCLDSNDRGEVYMLACNGGKYQDWYDISHHRLQNGATGRCLEYARQGASVFTQPCNTTNAWQGWQYL